MRTSATETSTRSSASTGSGARIVREATRRLVHHSSNAANAAAVNTEVLRSRLARGAGSDTLIAFAERAATAMEQVSAGVTVMRALLIALGEAAADDSAAFRPIPDDPEAVHVLCGPVLTLGSTAIGFAAAAGVGLRTTSDGVILKVLRRGAADDDVTG